MLGIGLLLKNYCPVSLLSVVSKVFEKLLNSRIVDHLEKCGRFSNFQYGFRSSRSLAYLLTVVSDRVASAFYSDRLHDISVTIPSCYKDVYVNSFFPRMAKIWDSLPIECFPLTYDLSGVKSRINRHLLTVGLF